MCINQVEKRSSIYLITYFAYVILGCEVEIESRDLAPLFVGMGSRVERQKMRCRAEKAEVVK